MIADDFNRQDLKLGFGFGLIRVHPRNPRLLLLFHPFEPDVMDDSAAPFRGPPGTWTLMTY